MFKNRTPIKAVVRKLRYRTVEFDLQPYRLWLDKINEWDFSAMDDFQLKSRSFELKNRVRSGDPVNEVLAEAYALAREASHRVLGLRPFDVQVMAGIAMHDGGLVEMQTGEGKTLAAVLPAYLNALSGKGVHVLTFNDYLAQRDAQWMGPVYEFLGLSVGYVREGMTAAQRKRAYACDVTYLTAKEAGFDYLKEFLCREKEEMVQRPFHFAIIDEADSILIDEARIPLVIAGKNDEYKLEAEGAAAIVRRLTPGVDYETDENERNVYLTDTGVNRVEDMLGCGNLYEDKNITLLVSVNNALHAEALLKRDVDYIVRNGKIELVDEFTGRVAHKRHWPNGLQEAIEAKEGIKSESKGQIIASVTLQNFIRLYPKFCGMTGTAVTSAGEFAEFYGLKVVVIPTNRPCIRVDYTDKVYTHREAKERGLIAEITQVHKTGRPILVGTCSVEESERLAAKLKAAGIDCRVLNAKNDELEAKIIANAGALGAVTVSTNMAGRGTDIKLGGEQEQDREQVVREGGLYVIGTNLHESRRIDNQLRGRAGRQGDPGSSRFFISLEDDLLRKYKVKNLIPPSIYPQRREEPVENPVIRRKIAGAQRIIEGQNFEIRRTLTKYSALMEQQRRMIYKWRKDLLEDRVFPGLMQSRLSERWHRLCALVGEEGVRRAEKQAALYFINKCWTDYLDYMSYIREGIHLVNVGGKTPVHEFNKIAVEAFERLTEDIKNEIVGLLARAEITEAGINMEKEGLKAPSSTWTYLVNDSPEQLGINPAGFSPLAAAVNLPLWLIMTLYHRFFRKKGGNE
ncbi:MAG: accessory Sec system translocase SecA2 [Clostridiales bacterium]|jgi:preprotein translocase subunit SecA|nr:accessory Sec system translocase SecA2 [Eubacteriales bacterium]MDH7567495.1 accessory Sec system translocase SecA2 [Clostridiales bacterium]